MRHRAVRAAMLGFLTGFTFFVIHLRWLLELRHVIGNTLPAVIALVALASFLAWFVAAWSSFAGTVGRPSAVDLAPRGRNEAADRSAEGKPLHSGSRFMQATRRHEQFLGTLLKPSYSSLRFAGLNAATWTGLEWLRGWMLTGFGWNGLGVALHANPTLIQVADIVGVTGLSFLPMFVTGVVLNTIWRIYLEAGSRRLRPHLDFVAAIVLLLGVFFYGVDKASVPTPGHSVNLRALLVQPNIPQSLKWDPAAATGIYRSLDELTRLNVEVHPFDLVVWPEACLPLPLDHPEHRDYLERLAGIGDHQLLFGTTVREPRQAGEPGDSLQRIYNSAALLKDRVSEAKVHHKIHLVPFGEFLPLRNLCPPIASVFGNLLPADFDRGTTTDPLVLTFEKKDGRPNILLAPLICFEDTVPRVVRKFVRSGAPQLLVNLTNDGWFGESQASHQHLINAMFRCIELRRPMIRCANTGVSCVIDASGSIYDRDAGDGFRRVVEDPHSGNTFIRGTLPATIKLDPDPPITIYASVGDSFSIVCALLSLMSVFRAWIKPKTARPKSA